MFFASVSNFTPCVWADFKSCNQLKFVHGQSFLFGKKVYLKVFVHKYFRILIIKIAPSQ